MITQDDLNFLEGLKEQARELTADINAARAELKKVNSAIRIAEESIKLNEQKVTHTGPTNHPFEFADPHTRRVFITEENIEKAANRSKDPKPSSLKEARVMIKYLQFWVAALTEMVNTIDPKPITKRMTFND